MNGFTLAMDANKPPQHSKHMWPPPLLNTATIVFMVYKASLRPQWTLRLMQRIWLMFISEWGCCGAVGPLMNAPISAALPARPRRAPCRQGPGRDTAPARPGKRAAGWVFRLPWRSSVPRGCIYGVIDTACASRELVDAQVDCLFGPRVLRSGRHLKQTQCAPVKQVRVETAAQEL